METGLLLLMRDGALHVALHPRLTFEQYADLLARMNVAPVTCIFGNQSRAGGIKRPMFGLDKTCWVLLIAVGLVGAAGVRAWLLGKRS